MTYINQTNVFFKEKVYSNLAKFAVSPVSWAFTNEKSNEDSDSNTTAAVLDFSFKLLSQSFKMLLLIVASPVLIPATVITASLSFCSALLSAIAHTIALPFAVAADVIHSNSQESQPLLM